MARWEALRSVRDGVNKALEEARKGGVIGKSLEASVSITPAEGGQAELLQRYLPVLPELFIVSAVEVLPASGENVAVVKAPGEKCSRCWTVTKAPVVVQDAPLCPRCAAVVG